MLQILIFIVLQKPFDALQMTVDFLANIYFHVFYRVHVEPSVISAHDDETVDLEIVSELIGGLITDYVDYHYNHPEKNRWKLTFIKTTTISIKVMASQ